MDDAKRTIEVAIPWGLLGIGDPSSLAAIDDRDGSPEIETTRTPGIALLAWATDYVAALMGAKRVKASGWALAGAAAGTVAGVFTGFIGLLFMPLLGAMAGEWWALRGQGGVTTVAANGQRALTVGVATWLGMMIGTAVKLALVFVMVGVFAAAYFF